VADVNVLVVFSSRYGRAEKLALAAGLGAIQANANIRLRRVADAAGPGTISADPEWSRHLDRMTRDYVAPRPADPPWADVIIVGSRSEPCPELESFLDWAKTTGPLAGKIAAPLAAGQQATALKPLYAAAAAAGLIVVPAAGGGADEIAAARDFGQKVSRMALALKGVSSNV
jgi:NAD(P)H dehydrogenase (quinone)